METKITMTQKEAERILDEFVGEIVVPFGFTRRKDRRYERLENDAVALLSFPCHISSRGTCLFTIGIGLRFESLAKWLDEYPEDMPPTIGQPINLLRGKKSFMEWEFSNAGDLEKLQDTVLNDLKAYALPYIERCSRITDLRKVLESPNKQDWLAAGLNVDSRVTVLAAIMFTEGDKIGAIRTLDDGIKILKETLAGHPHEIRKRTFSMEYLRDRFLKEK